MPEDRPYRVVIEGLSLDRAQNFLRLLFDIPADEPLIGQEGLTWSGYARLLAPERWRKQASVKIEPVEPDKGRSVSGLSEGGEARATHGDGSAEPPQGSDGAPLAESEICPGCGSEARRICRAHPPFSRRHGHPIATSRKSFLEGGLSVNDARYCCTHSWHNEKCCGATTTWNTPDSAGDVEAVCVLLAGHDGRCYDATLGSFDR